MKARIIGDTTCTDKFFYHVVKIEGDLVTLGWHGRRGFWNETTRLKSELILVEEDSLEQQ